MVIEPREIELPVHDRDRALVEAHLQGDDDAFADLVRDHHNVLLAQAQRRLGSRTEAEDALQESYERAIRNMNRFGGEYRFGAWLSRILSNVCADAGARRRAERALPQRLGLEVSSAPDASDAVSDPATLAQLHRALAALPASQRTTFLLHEVDGLSYPEVADALGISEDNARARVHRAKTTLRDRLVRGAAAIVAFPAVLTALARRGLLRGGRARHGLSAVAENTVARPASTLPSVASQAATQVLSTPVAQAVITAAPSGVLRGSIAVGIAAGLVSTFAGVMPSSGSDSSASAPQVNSVVVQSAPTTLPDRLAVATPATAPNDSDGRTDTAPTGIAAAATSGTAVADWVARAIAAIVSPVAAGATDLTPGGAAAVGAPSACAWTTADAGGQPAASVPSSSSAANTLRTPLASLSAVGPSQSLSSSLGLVVPGHDDAPSGYTATGHSCVDPASARLVLDLSGPGGVAHLRGALVLTTTDGNLTDYLFRGTVVSDGTLPSGFTGEFVSLFQVYADNTAQLSIAFLGDAPAMTPVDSAPSAPSAPGDTQQQPPATTTPPTTTTPPAVDTPYYPGSLYGPSGVGSRAG